MYHQPRKSSTMLAALYAASLMLTAATTVLLWNTRGSSEVPWTQKLIRQVAQEPTKIGAAIEKHREQETAQNNLLGLSFLAFTALALAPFAIRILSQETNLKSFALAAQGSSNAIVHLDRHRRVTWPNEPFLKLFNLTREEATQLTIDQILDQHPRSIEGLEQLTAAFGDSPETILRMKFFAEGEADQWFKVKVQSISQRGKGTGYVLLLSDITQDLLLHQALSAREAQLRLTVEGARLGTWRWKHPEGTLECNHLMAEMLGYKLSKWPNHVNGFKDLIHPEDWPAADAALKSHLNGECDEISVEFRLKNKQGEYQWVLVRGRVSETCEAGRPRELVGIQMDIDFAKKNAAKAADSERRLKTIFNALVEGVVVQDSHGKIIASNPQAERILGITHDQLIGKTTADPSWRLEDQHGEPLTQENHPSNIVLRTGKGVRNVPIRMRRGTDDWRWIAVNADPILDDQGEITATIASFVDITERREGEEALNRAARYDRLTGLPNRTALLTELQLAVNEHLEKGKQYGLLFIDSDRFKMVNDSLGHEAGDQLLIHIARRIRNVMEVTLSRDTLTNSIAARLGGDEFVVLLGNLSNAEEMRFFAETLTNESLQPHFIQGHDIVSSASIGMVMADVRYDRAEDVLRDADTAMYEAKYAGKARAVMFDSAMRDKINRRLVIEKELRHAIANDELELYYQPIVSFETGESKSFEALVRWHHPERGFILPSDFIPVAEETGLIVSLGEWVLRRSFKDLAEWTRQNCLKQVGGVSINLSRAQIVMAELPEVLKNLADEYQVSPSNIILEITESAVMEDEAKAVECLRRLKKAGYRIGLDDFGTGYSSLSCIQEFPLDEIKIDRSFVTGYKKGTTKANMIDAILTIASGLDLVVVAEGLETLDEYEGLRRAGCHLGQGYGIGKPMPASQVPNYENPMVAVPRRAA